MEERGDSYRWVHTKWDDRPFYQRAIRAIVRFPEDMMDRVYAIFGVGIRPERKTDMQRKGLPGKQ